MREFRRTHNLPSDTDSTKEAFGEELGQFTVAVNDAD
jgi:hypothetical protein